jgi:hypothetical protein
VIIFETKKNKKGMEINLFGRGIVGRMPDGDELCPVRSTPEHNKSHEV